jgi:hypothetical protein
MNRYFLHRAVALPALIKEFLFNSGTKWCLTSQLMAKQEYIKAVHKCEERTQGKENLHGKNIQKEKESCKAEISNG